MSLLGALWNLVKAIFGAIFKFIKKYLAIILVILIIVCIIYFAPAIAAWLGSVGAPGWLVTAFEWIGTTITPTFTQWVGYLWDGVSSLASKSWTAYSNAGLGTQLSIATGLAAAIAPEETAALLEEAGSLIGDVIGNLATGLLTTPVGLGIAAFAVWWLFLRKKKDDTTVTVEPWPPADELIEGEAS